jgi:hypothetical protein
VLPGGTKPSRSGSAARPALRAVVYRARRPGSRAADRSDRCTVSRVITRFTVHSRAVQRAWRLTGAANASHQPHQLRQHQKLRPAVRTAR